MVINSIQSAMKQSRVGPLIFLAASVELLAESRLQPRLGSHLGS